MNFTLDLFTFPFQDENRGSKLVVGGLLAFISMLFFPLYVVLLGYGASVLRHAAAGNPPEMPEWDDWGQFFTDGLRIAGITLVYMLPVMVLYVVAYVFIFGAAFAPIFMAGAEEEVYPVFGAAMFGSYLVMMVCMGLGFGLSIPLGYLALVAGTRSIVQESFQAGLDFREVFAIAKRDAGKYIVAYIVVMVAYMAVMMVAFIFQMTIVCACLVYFIYPLGMYYLTTVMGAAFGSAYHASQTNPSELVVAV